MSSLLGRVNMAGQKPPLCKKPPLPPVDPLPWPPRRLYASVHAQHQAPGQPLEQMSAHFQLDHNPTTGRYTGVRTEPSQQLALTIIPNAPARTILIAVTYSPPSGGFSPTVYATANIGPANPLWLEVRIPSAYPAYTAADIALAE